MAILGALLADPRAVPTSIDAFEKQLEQAEQDQPPETKNRKALKVLKQ